jgi:hypothetical protein
MGISTCSGDLFVLSGPWKRAHILNIYGPYLDRVEYWDRVLNMEWIQRGLVVVEGDFNFTLGESELWGPTAQVDYLVGYFIIFFGRSGFTRHITNKFISNMEE